MTLRTLCASCRYGDHANHVRVIQPVAEGVLGGAECPCEGGCEAQTCPRCGYYMSALGVCTHCYVAVAGETQGENEEG